MLAGARTRPFALPGADLWSVAGLGLLPTPRASVPPAGPSRPNPRVWNRRLHRWGAVAIGVPFLLIIGTGLLLQVKKQVAWVQPPELRTEVRAPSVPYDRLLALAS